MRRDTQRSTTTHIRLPRRPHLLRKYDRLVPQLSRWCRNEGSIANHQSWSPSGSWSWSIIHEPWKEPHTPNCESWSVCADFASWDATEITANIRLELGKVIYEQHRETADLRVVLWKLTSPTNHIQKTSDVRQLHHKSLRDQNVSTCSEKMAMKFVKICTNSNRDSHYNRESGAQESET